MNQPAPPPIPDHELLRCIGSGSYGDVWLARSVTGQWRAVKLVYRARFDRDKPYEREFAGLQKFEPVSRSHESQVDILHIGHNEEFFYYVMELADDENSGQAFNPDNYSPKSLRSELRKRKQLPAAECLQIGLALATALEHLHAHGLVHRDVKPSNIIYVEGVAKLADIGLVTGVEATRSFVGTEGYLPPEGPGTPSADLYGLGKVLYEAAFGRDRLDFPEIPSLVGESPERAELLELNEIILKACASEPHDRYATAVEMRCELERLQRGGSVKRGRDARRRFKLTLQLGAVALLGAGVLVAVNRLRPRSSSSAPPAPSVSSFSALEETDKQLAADETPQALAKLTASLRTQPTLRAAATKLVTILSQRTFALPMAAPLAHNTTVTAAWFSPDGTKLFTSCVSAAPSIWDARDGRLIARCRVSPPFGNYAGGFGPDGTWCASVARDGVAAIWDANSGELRRGPMTNRPSSMGLVVSPDGKRLLVWGRFWWRLWDATTGQPVTDMQSNPPAIGPGRFSPDGNRFCLPGVDGFVTMFDAATGQALATHPRLDNGVTALAWSPDGRRLFAGSAACTGTIFSNGSSTPPFICSPAERMPIIAAEFSPDGGRLLVGSGASAQVADGSLREWVTSPVAAKPKLAAAAMSPDGLSFATAALDHTSRLWDAFTGAPLTERMRHGNFLTTIAFRADGCALLSAGADKTAVLWDIRDGVARREDGGLWNPPEVPVPVSETVLKLAEALGGARLSESNTLETVEAAETFALRSEVKQAAPGGFYGEWLRWFFADRGTRPIHPGAATTVPQLASRLAEKNQFGAMVEALRLAPGNAQLWARLATWPRATAAAGTKRELLDAEFTFAAARARALAPDDAEVRRLLKSLPK